MQHNYNSDTRQHNYNSDGKMQHSNGVSSPSRLGGSAPGRLGSSPGSTHVSQAVPAPKARINMSQKDLEEFFSDWRRYKSSTEIHETRLGRLLYFSCDPQLQRKVSARVHDPMEADEDQMLKVIKSESLVPSSSLSPSSSLLAGNQAANCTPPARSGFSSSSDVDSRNSNNYTNTVDSSISRNSNNYSMRRRDFVYIQQNKDETATRFIARLRMAALHCNWKCCPCTVCPGDCGYVASEEHVRDQLLRGMMDKDLQHDLMERDESFRDISAILSAMMARESARARAKSEDREMVGQQREDRKTSVDYSDLVGKLLLGLK